MNGITIDGKVEAGYPTQGLLAEELKKVIPEVQYASGYEYASAPGTQNNFEAGEKVNKMIGVFAGADFFQMFSYPLLQGKAGISIECDRPELPCRRKWRKYFFESPAKLLAKRSVLKIKRTCR